MKKKRRVLIVGAGDLGKQFEHFISNYSDDIVTGWLDDTKKVGESIRGISVVGGVEDVGSIAVSFDCVAIAIGYHHLKFKLKLLREYKTKKLRMYTFVHPTAYVDCTSKIKEGAFIYPHVTIDQRVVIGEATILNNNVVISHDSTVGLASFLSPSVTISGNVKIGNRCFIGSASVVKDSIQICDSTQLGARTLVINDIYKPGKYVGGPQLRKL